jgi:hypothetical protein
MTAAKITIMTMTTATIAYVTSFELDEVVVEVVVTGMEVDEMTLVDGLVDEVVLVVTELVLDTELLEVVLLEVVELRLEDEVVIDEVGLVDEVSATLYIDIGKSIIPPSPSVKLIPLDQASIWVSDAMKKSGICWFTR